jgi:ACS family pantothenate transporter-like MFS transporter
MRKLHFRNRFNLSEKKGLCITNMSYPIEKDSQPQPAEVFAKDGTQTTFRVEGAESSDRLSTANVPRQKWYQWFSPSDTPEERRLILKLDALIMIFVFLAYWAKVLDSSATSAAYVSGMKEDLKLFGNELNYLNTTYM